MKVCQSLIGKPMRRYVVYAGFAVMVADALGPYCIPKQPGRRLLDAKSAQAGTATGAGGAATATCACGLSS